MKQTPANKNHLQFYSGYVTKLDRQRLNRHRSGLVWFTGLPGSGKSTLAHLLEKELFQHGVRAYVLDGDNVRHGLNADLGFSREDRQENMRRIVEVSKLLVDAGIIVLSAFISPYRADRELPPGRPSAMTAFWKFMCNAPWKNVRDGTPRANIARRARGSSGNTPALVRRMRHRNRPIWWLTPCL